MREITDAATATITTRAYCMNATSRASAPNASAISIIAVAPPGEAPHTAVEPGSTCQRLISQPSVLLATITAETSAMKSGQSSRNVSIIPGVIEFAMRQPTTAWLSM